LRHEWNRANTLDSQLAWFDHEVPAAVEGCFGAWCLCKAFPPRMRADLARACGEANWAKLEFVDKKMQNIGKAKNG